jgi:hypothetical protein
VPLDSIAPQWDHDLESRSRSVRHRGLVDDVSSVRSSMRLGEQVPGRPTHLALGTQAYQSWSMRNTVSLTVLRGKAKRAESSFLAPPS